MKCLLVLLLLGVMPLVSCVGQPATVAFVPATFAGSLTAATANTAIEEYCGTADVVTSSNSPASSVSVTVNNGGECAITVKLTHGSADRGSVTAQAGKPASISTSSVSKVTISCDGQRTESKDCKFTYSISWN